MKSDLENLQGQVERQLGHCMIRLQQCEGLLKSMMAPSIAFQGKFEELPSFICQQRASLRTSTLGTLKKRFVENHLGHEGLTAEPPHWEIEFGALQFSTRFSLLMSPESLTQVESDLTKLVSLRNDLAHHFVERYDIFSEDGCRASIAYLVECDEYIEKNRSRLRRWTVKFSEAQALLASQFLSTGVFEEQSSSSKSE